MGENISRTSSLVVVISPIGPCSDPGDELTMTAHCPLSDVVVVMIAMIIIMKMGILHQPFHCDLPRDNLMTKHKAWFPDGCGVLPSENLGTLPLWEGARVPKDQKRSIPMFARN